MAVDWSLLLQFTLNGLIVGALYGVVAMSFVLIYKASQVVNFAQGEFLLVGAWVCWWVLTTWQLPFWAGFLVTFAFMTVFGVDRKSTRLNSSHANISYAVFCLKKKQTQDTLLWPIHAVICST